MSLFTTIGTTFESSISSFTATTASGVIGMITPLILIGVTLYFTITGYMIMAGRISEPLGDVMIKGAKISLIAMVGLSTGTFMTYVAGAAHGLEGDFLNAMGSSATNVYQLLDNSWEQGYANVAQIFAEASDKSFLTEASAMIALFFAGIIGVLALAALSGIGAGIVMVAKMSLVVVLGFGPLFICALMFPATANWFNSWLSAVLKYVFTSAFVSAFLIIFINLFLHYNNYMSQDLSAINMDAEGSIQTIIYGCVSFLIVALISIYGMREVPGIAAALAGGVASGATSITSMMSNSVRSITSPAKSVAGVTTTTAKMTYGAANIASRGALGRAGQATSTRLQNISNRYMKRDNSIRG